MDQQDLERQKATLELERRVLGDIMFEQNLRELETQRRQMTDQQRTHHDEIQRDFIKRGAFTTAASIAAAEALRSGGGTWQAQHNADEQLQQYRIAQPTVILSALNDPELETKRRQAMELERQAIGEPEQHQLQERLAKQLQAMETDREKWDRYDAIMRLQIEEGHVNSDTARVVAKDLASGTSHPPRYAEAEQRSKAYRDTVERQAKETIKQSGATSVDAGHQRREALERQLERRGITPTSDGPEKVIEPAVARQAGKEVTVPNQPSPRSPRGAAMERRIEQVRASEADSRQHDAVHTAASSKGRAR